MSANGQQNQSTAMSLKQAAEFYAQDKLDSSEYYYRIAYKQNDAADKLSGLAGLIKISIFKNNFDFIESLLPEGDQLARQLPYQKAVINYMLMKGEYFRKTSRYREATSLHLETVGKTKKLKEDKDLHADALLYSALCYEQLTRYDSSLIYASKAYDIYRTTIDTNSTRFGSVANSVGVCYYRANQFDRAKELYLKAKHIAETNLGPTSSDLSNVLGNLAVLENLAQNYSEAITYGEKCLRINKALGDKEGMSFNYYSLGVNHYYLGDYGRAKDYLEACIDIREQIFHPLHSRLVWPYQVLGITLKESGDFKKAIHYYEKSRKILQANFGENSIEEAYLDENIATSYLNIGKIDSALSYIKKASNVLLKNLAEADYSRSIHHFSLANVYYNNAQYPEAKKHLEQSIQFLKNNGYAKTGDYAQNLGLMALIDSEMGNFNSGDSYFSEALGIIGDEDTFMYSNTAFWVLGSYADYQYQNYLRTGDTSSLNQFISYSDKYLEYSNLFRKQFHDPYTKSALISDNVKVFSNSIAIYNSLYRNTNEKKYLEAAYKYSEHSRTALLRDMMDAKIQHIAGLDDSLLLKEKALQKQITALNQDYLEHPDSTEIKRQLFESKEALNEHVKEVLQIQPQYYDAKFESKILDLATIKSKMGAGENLLEYMKDDTAYYVLILNSDISELKYLGNKTIIDAAIGQYRGSIQNKNSGTFNDVSKQLYRHLFSGVEPLIRGEKITIVPSGSLYYLNFETLTRTGDPATYLIYDYNISYALSFNVLYSELNKSGSRKNNLAVAIAPGFEDGIKENYTRSLDTMELVDEDYLYTVRQPWSVKLADKLKKDFRNLAFTGNNATETQVKSNLHKGNVLYFGTHAITNADDPLRSRLVLAKEVGQQKEDGYLHAYEMYGLSLNADLAVLSACETGIGSLKEGEGMISLAYSLNFAGCPSTMISLWKVDEKTNTRITDLFFNHLAKGETKSGALRKAKLDYLNSADPMVSHPYYWSGMILMGNDGQVNFSKKTSWNFYIMGMALLLLTLVFLKRRKADSKK